jgi:PPOX class probable F420-dependent enzyme
MNNISDEKKAFIDSFLEGSHIARLATVDRDGKPHVVPVWYAWDGETIWISSYSSTRKIMNLEENRKVSIIIDITGGEGETKAVLFEGQAQLIREPRDFLREKFYWIYKRYLGEEGVMAKNPQEWIEDSQNLLISLKPENVFTWKW